MLRKPLRPFLLLLSLVITASAQTNPAVQTVADLAQKAEAAYPSKHFADSAGLYVQAIQQQILLQAEPSDRNGVEYNAACSFALAGDKDDTILWLSRAIEDGFLDLQHTSTDADLTTLHTDPRWATLLHRMTTISAAEKTHWSADALNTPFSQMRVPGHYLHSGPGTWFTSPRGESGSGCGFAAGFAGLKGIAVEAVGMWESRRDFQRSVGRVESRLHGFPCFPHPVISMACPWVFKFPANGCILVE